MRRFQAALQPRAAALGCYRGATQAEARLATAHAGGAAALTGLGHCGEGQHIDKPQVGGGWKGMNVRKVWFGGPAGYSILKHLTLTD